MKILFTAPTAMEIKPFADQVPREQICITGVGGIATTYNLLKKLDEDPYDFVIQAGVCGSFDLAVHPIGEVVLVARDNLADIGIVEDNAFESMQALGYGSAEDSVFIDGWLINESLDLTSFPYPQVSAISVNTITEEKMSSNIFYKRFLPEIESMEGGAFHYVCAKRKVPFLQMRAVSNEVGERDKKLWRMQEAISALCVALPKIVTLLKNTKIED